MSNDVTDDAPQVDAGPVADEPGWRVLNPDGTVAASGPGIVLEATMTIGGGQ